MAKIQPTPARARQAFRDQLPERARGAFDRLAKLIDHPRADLRWHHEVGTRARRLMLADPDRPSGAWWPLLKRALGPCPAVFQKAARFAQLYPSERYLAALARLGVDWTRASLAFVIGDRKERHEMLRRARQEGWTGQQLRFEIQRQYPSRRRGAGGRPRRDPVAYGADVTLRELERLCRRWLAFHERAWQAVKPSEWGRLVGECRGEDLDQLLRLFRSADEALEGVAGACQNVRDTLAGLRQRAELKQGWPSSD